ncbi:hypothetical protein F4808DRAFT_466770 [Astrocystis sublimbata]|nr:hypothetical protein F4808DRAFT_466770 [Astrocystis sublimbata]
MRFVQFSLLPSLCLAAAVLPREGGEEKEACTTPSKRVEYRTLDAATQKEYTDAVWCLTKKPSRIGLNTTLYDDFTFVHSSLNSDIHFVAQFLPWHRYFVGLYETELRACGYTGPMAYWDWTLDVADPATSSIWDPVLGLGGNGVNANETDRLRDALIDSVKDGVYFCVSDGPFAGLNVSYFRTKYQPHCLDRNFNSGVDFPGDMLSFAYTPEVLAKINKLPGYDEFRQNLEGNPHGAVHSAIGGDMSPSSSPNDPIFFLHHVQIDRLWSKWQQEKPETRTNEYAGRRTQAVPENTDEVSIDDIMPFFGFTEDIKVSDVMSHKTALLCYEY